MSMTTKFWIGGTENFETQSGWTDNQPIARGDLAIISSGTPYVTSDTIFSGYTLNIASTDPSNPASLETDGVDTINAGDGVISTGPVTGDDPNAIYNGNIFVNSGTLTNEGWMQTTGNHSAMNVQLLYGNLTNYGFIGAQGTGASITFSVPETYSTTQTPSSVTNDSVIQASGGSLDFAAPVNGNGQISVVNHGHVTIEDSLGDGQHIALTSGILEVSNPARMSFLGSVRNLTSASTFEIDGGYTGCGAKDRLTLSDITKNGEMLNLRSNGQNLFSVYLEGNYKLSDFHLAQQGSTAFIGYEHTPTVISHPVG